MPVAIPPPEVPVQVAEQRELVVESHGYVYQVVGNTLLPDEEVRRLLEEAKAPKEALGKLDQAYRKRGYFLVTIIARRQGKRVILRVIEGRIGEKRLPPRLSWFFLGLENREDITRSQLMRNMVLAEAYLRREGLKPKLRFEPGEAPGTTAMILEVEPAEEAKPWSVAVSANNYGSRFSGRGLAQGSLSVRPGWGSEFGLNYTTFVPAFNLTERDRQESAGSKYEALNLSASFITPLGIYGANYSHSDYLIGDITAPLNPDGNIESYGITGSQLLYADARSRWLINEGFTTTDNEVDVFQGEFRLTDQHYDYLTLGTFYNRRFSFLGKDLSFSGTLSYTKGLSGSNELPGQPDFSFEQYLVSASLEYSLPEDLLLKLYAEWQYSPSTVPQLQQYVLGGINKIRAYLPGSMIGDGGRYGRVSLERSWRLGPVKLVPAAFAEVGSTTFAVSSGGDPLIADAGLSLTASTDWKTQLSLIYAAPLVRNNVNEASLRRADLFVGLSQRF